jgi:hypothetical protein
MRGRITEQSKDTASRMHNSATIDVTSLPILVVYLRRFGGTDPDLGRLTGFIMPPTMTLPMLTGT